MHGDGHSHAAGVQPARAKKLRNWVRHKRRTPRACAVCIWHVTLSVRSATGARRPALGRELEALEFETRRDRAAHQRPVAEAFGCLPDMRRHHRLRAFAGREIGAERDALDRTVAARGDLEPQRAAGVVVPDLGGVDPVPVRALAARQQKIDRGRVRRGRSRACVAMRLREVTALGMRLEAQQPDDLGGGVMICDRPIGDMLEFVLAGADFGEHLGRRMRRPCRPPWRPPAHRRAGTGWRPSPRPGARAPSACRRRAAASTCCSRAASALLSGSMVLAKRMFASVYSWPQWSMRVVGQRAQLQHRLPHLLHRAFDHAAAADREQRVAGEHELVGGKVERRRRRGMAGRHDHASFERADADGVAVAHGLVDRRGCAPASPSGATTRQR